jgi:hypothetical protein
MTDLAERTGIPYPSVHREIERALAVGLVSERLVGRTRVIRADTTSPYFDGLSDVLVKALRSPLGYQRRTQRDLRNRSRVHLRFLGGKVLGKRW